MNYNSSRNAELKTCTSFTWCGLKREPLTKLYPMQCEAGWESSLSAFEIVDCGLVVTSSHVEHPERTQSHQCLSAYFRTQEHSHSHRTCVYRNHAIDGAD